MVKAGLDEITMELSLTFEEATNSLYFRTAQQLFKYMKSPDWMAKQLASAKYFRSGLFRLANKELKEINRQYKEAFTKGLKNVDEVASRDALARLDTLVQQNGRMMQSLANQFYEGYKQFVATAQFDMEGKVEISPLDRSTKVYNEICKVMDSGKLENMSKVYVNGKKMPFKSYMEMNARTTLNEEIGKQQMDAAPSVGVVFWLCNSFENCRTSHIPYQGKVYYDERWTSYGYNEEMTNKINDAIAKRNMKSRQSVEDSDPFLGNCPNCRHEFIAVPIEDVVSMSDHQLLVDNNMNVDKATEEKYELSQEQRLYERKVRHYKTEMEKSKQILENAPEGVSNEDAQKQLEHDTFYMRKYQGKLRELCRNNPSCERDYDRENPRIIREDLGYRENKL